MIRIVIGIIIGFMLAYSLRNYKVVRVDDVKHSQASAAKDGMNLKFIPDSWKSTVKKHSESEKQAK